MTALTSAIEDVFDDAEAEAVKRAFVRGRAAVMMGDDRKGPYKRNRLLNNAFFLGYDTEDQGWWWNADKQVVVELRADTKSPRTRNRAGSRAADRAR